MRSSNHCARKLILTGGVRCGANSSDSIIWPVLLQLLSCPVVHMASLESKLYVSGHVGLSIACMRLAVGLTACLALFLSVFLCVGRCVCVAVLFLSLSLSHLKPHVRARTRGMPADRTKNSVYATTETEKCRVQNLWDDDNHE